jgi:hypothetical protein
MLLFVMMATLLVSLFASIAAIRPAMPEPMTITSYVMLSLHFIKKIVFGCIGRIHRSDAKITADVLT